MAGRPDLVMLEPKRCSQPLVPRIVGLCQVLNLQRSLLLTCTEEPRAELIHQELQTSACRPHPWRQQARAPYPAGGAVEDQPLAPGRPRDCSSWGDFGLIQRKIH